MCFKTNIPQPKEAPPPPDPNKATLEAVTAQRRALADSVGRRDTILTRLRDEEAAAPARKRKLGSG